MDIRSGAGQTWGKYANNIHTLNITKDLTGYKEGDDIKFTATIPQNGFPHKKRCLVMIDSLSFRLQVPVTIDAATSRSVAAYALHYDSIMCEPTVAVSLDGLGVMNSYDTMNKQNEIVGVVRTFVNKAGTTGVTNAQTTARVSRHVSSRDTSGDFFARGVLAQSPFGKSLGIRILDASTLKPLVHSNDSGAYGANNAAGIRGTSVSLVLKILFLDEEDMKSV